jgi:hypothetical protein
MDDYRWNTPSGSLTSKGGDRLWMSEEKRGLFPDQVEEFVEVIRSGRPLSGLDPIGG